jgi:predicted dithiol-disulfide oxidoreductase (DUF899 family)
LDKLLNCLLPESQIKYILYSISCAYVVSIASMSTAVNHPVVSREKWNKLRGDLLKKEKELTKARDALTAEIRELPWVKVEKEYVFHTTYGDKTFPELFDGKSQLFIYHFMFAPGWDGGCSSCSLWADNFGGLCHHLPQRDVSFKVISRATLKEIQEYRKRMGWEFDWVSSNSSDFNLDFGSSSNKASTKRSSDEPLEVVENACFSVFYHDGNDVYQTYFTTGRGIEPIDAVYAALDLVPKGRDEKGLPHPMAWIRRHDEY